LIYVNPSVGTLNMPVELVKTAFASPPIGGDDAMAEANHRIANNLAMIAGLVRMNGRRLAAAPRPATSGEVLVMLEEIGTRIDTVARLHGLLARADDSRSIDIGDYLRELSEAVVGSLTVAAKARLSFHATGDCLIASERALPLGFLVVELITNAVKYAHPAGVTGLIDVSCEGGNGNIVVAIADDGVGLPEGFDPEQSGGLGFRLMRSLAEQVKAKLTFHDTGTGLTARVQLPVG